MKGWIDWKWSEDYKRTVKDIKYRPMIKAKNYSKQANSLLECTPPSYNRSYMTQAQSQNPGHTVKAMCNNNRPHITLHISLSGTIEHLICPYKCRWPINYAPSFLVKSLTVTPIQSQQFRSFVLSFNINNSCYFGHAVTTALRRRFSCSSHTNRSWLTATSHGASRTV